MVRGFFWRKEGIRVRKGGGNGCLTGSGLVQGKKHMSGRYCGESFGGTMPDRRFQIIVFPILPSWSIPSRYLEVSRSR